MKNENKVTIKNKKIMIHKFSRYLLTLVALLTMTTGAWADGVKIKFAANGNEKVVTVESLPHTFWCNHDNASDELDLIIKELYGWPNSSYYYCDNFEPYPSASGNDKVTAGKDGKNHYVTIAEGFEGSATVTGQYKIAGGIATYELAISLAEAYDLTLSPATNANLKSVTVAGTAKTADENGVIKNIEPTKKVKITTTGPDYIIRKATVKKTVKQ